MPTNTTNFSLIKPGQEEFYNVDVPNSNMDTIDGVLKALQDAINSGASEQDLQDLRDDLATHLAEKGTATDFGHVKADNITIKSNNGEISSEGLFKLIQFTRDMTAPSGTQEINGVGFKPKAVIFIAFIADGTPAGWGFDLGNSSMALIDITRGVAGANKWSNTSTSINLQTTGPFIAQHAKIASLDTDGFTLNWTKAGLPEGIGTVMGLVMR